MLYRPEDVYVNGDLLKPIDADIIHSFTMVRCHECGVDMSGCPVVVIPDNGRLVPTLPKWDVGGERRAA